MSTFCRRALKGKAMTLISIFSRIAFLHFNHAGGLKGVTIKGLHLKILHIYIPNKLIVFNSKQTISTVNQIINFSIECKRGDNYRKRLS